MVANSTNSPLALRTAFKSPFPVVGGLVRGLEKDAAVLWKDPRGSQSLTVANGEASLDGAVAQLALHPTYEFHLEIAVPANTSIKFGANARLFVDFQFAESALLRLKSAPTQFSVAGENLPSFSGQVLVRP